MVTSHNGLCNSQCSVPKAGVFDRGTRDSARARNQADVAVSMTALFGKKLYSQQLVLLYK